MPFSFPPELAAYVEAHTTAHSALLARLVEETRAETEAPQMLTGPIEGRFLETLVFALQARNVLEIGTFTGYGALSMAPALPEGGRIVTCELVEHHASIARRYFDESGYADRIDLRMGPALATVEADPGPWDLVFVDAEKEGYRDYYEAVVPKLSPRGLIAADNTLRGGTVVDPPDPADPNADAMRAFNDHVQADPRTTNVMLTVRDGITLIRLAD